MSDINNLPYRPCAGIMLVNQAGQVFVGQRLDNPDSDAWQMPQGGIDEGETAREAALRELTEETGIEAHLVDIIGETVKELFYDLPDELIGKIWKGKWRGQRQKWFLMRFKGSDENVNIATDHQEFSRWKWAEAAALPDMIVPFKKELYKAVLQEFSSTLGKD